MTANPFAALLDGVPRYRLDTIGDMERDENGPYVFCDDVLAALAAAVPADLAEAGKVLEGVTLAIDSDDDAYVLPSGADTNLVALPARGDDYAIQHPEIWQAMVARFNVYPALLARIAAQEAQINGLEAEVAEVTSDRAYIIGANAGWEAAVEHGEATPAAAAMLAQLEAAEKRPSWDEYNAVLSAGYEQKARAEAAETALAAEWAKVAKLVGAWDLARSHSLVKVTLGDGDARKSWGDFLIAMDEARAAITEAGQ